MGSIPAKGTKDCSEIFALGAQEEFLVRQESKRLSHIF